MLKIFQPFKSIFTIPTLGISFEKFDFFFKNFQKVLFREEINFSFTRITFCLFNTKKCIISFLPFSKIFFNSPILNFTFLKLKIPLFEHKHLFLKLNYLK